MYKLVSLGYRHDVAGVGHVNFYWELNCKFILTAQTCTKLAPYITTPLVTPDLVFYYLILEGLFILLI